MSSPASIALRRTITNGRRAVRSFALIVFASIVVSSIGLASCAKAEHPGNAVSPTPAATGGKQAGEKTGEVSKKPSSSPRKIIQNGELHLEVKDYRGIRRILDKLVADAGGFVASSQIAHNAGQVSSAEIVVRVPSTSLATIMDRLSQLGTVAKESLSSQDITEEYYDLSARLSNARKLETRFLDLLDKQTGKLTDVLQVERELSRVREEIERIEGKLRLWDRLVDLSTLKVNLYILVKYEPPRSPTLGEEAGDILGASFESIKAIGRGLILLGVALLPWIPICLIVVFFIIWMRRRARRRAALKKP